MRYSAHQNRFWNLKPCYLGTRTGMDRFSGYSDPHGLVFRVSGIVNCGSVGVCTYGSRFGATGLFLFCYSMVT